ncbi:MAG TPA: hypothetical protein VF113_07020 [Stellaceae bacterium]
MRFALIAGVAVVALSLNTAATPAQAMPVADNEFFSAGEGAWGNDNAEPGTIAGLLVAQFDNVFAPTNDLLEIGIPGKAGFSIIFDDGQSLIKFLPAQGPAGPLTADLLDPATSSAGFFAGEVATLAINIAFSDAGLIAHPAGTAFGDLEFTGLSGALSSLNGQTIRSLFPEVNVLLGGGTEAFTINDVAETLIDTNQAFGGGINGEGASTFALNHLEFPTVVTAVPEPPLWPIFVIGSVLVIFFSHRRAEVRLGT